MTVFDCVELTHFTRWVNASLLTFSYFTIFPASPSFYWLFFCPRDFRMIVRITLLMKCCTTSLLKCCLHAHASVCYTQCLGRTSVYLCAASLLFPSPPLLVSLWNNLADPVFGCVGLAANDFLLAKAALSLV